MVAFAPVPSVLSNLAANLPPIISQSPWSLVATLVYILYYLNLSFSFGLLGVALVSALLVACNTFLTAFGAAAFNIAVAAHIVAWIAQFYAHAKFEGRKPALFDSLAQSLLMAPLFVTIELFMINGLFKSFRKSVQPLINSKLAAHKAKDAAKKA